MCALHMTKYILLACCKNYKAIPKYEKYDTKLFYLKRERNGMSNSMLRVDVVQFIHSCFLLCLVYHITIEPILSNRYCLWKYMLRLFVSLQSPFLSIHSVFLLQFFVFLSSFSSLASSCYFFSANQVSAMKKSPILFYYRYTYC